MPPPLQAAAKLGLSLRAMSDEDLPFVEALFASTRADLFAGMPPAQRDALLALQHRSQHQHYRGAYPDAEWLIVERGDEPVGRLYLQEEPRAVRLIDISLVPQVRGQGIGAALLGDLLEAARDQGRDVVLHVEHQNPARRLYERLGFAPVEDKGVYLEMAWSPPP